jgi:dihydroorotate dehydrogenase electron transfer subunit
MKKKLIQDFRVVENKILGDKYFLLTLHSIEPLPEILPGQFVQVEILEAKNTFLRRPLSVHDVDYNNNTLKLLVQILGDGTKKLSQIQKGENLNLLYPLGNSFSINETDKVLLVGGGCGIAPLLYLARKMKEKDMNVSILIGGASKSNILEVDEYRKYGEVHITTMDASEGEKGLVTQHSIFKKASFDFTRLYCCGPEPMMKALAGIAREKGIDCEVSLENLMACGIGACLCCVVDTKDGNKCTCTEGPVYEYKYLKGW